MRFWRSLKRMGCAVLRDGVYLLPQSESGGSALQELADEIIESGGSASVVQATSRDVLRTICSEGCSTERGVCGARQVAERGAQIAVRAVDARDQSAMRACGAKYEALVRSIFFRKTKRPHERGNWKEYCRRRRHRPFAR